MLNYKQLKEAKKEYVQTLTDAVKHVNEQYPMPDDRTKPTYMMAVSDIDQHVLIWIMDKSSNNYHYTETEWAVYSHEPNVPTEVVEQIIEAIECRIEYINSTKEV